MEVMDLYTFFELLCNMDLQAIETLFTEYYIINPRYKGFWEELRATRFECSRLNERLWGEQLLARLEINRRRFLSQEGLTPGMEKTIGYTPKGVYHTVRQEEMARKYFQKEPYDKVLRSSNCEFLCQIKRGKFNEAEAKELLEEYEQKARALISNSSFAPINTKSEYKVYKLFKELLERR